MKLDQLPHLMTLPAPSRVKPLDDERIPVNDDTRGEAKHEELIRAYIARVRGNVAATPLPLHPTAEGHEL